MTRLAARNTTLSTPSASAIEERTVSRFAITDHRAAPIARRFNRCDTNSHSALRNAEAGAIRRRISSRNSKVASRRRQRPQSRSRLPASRRQRRKVSRSPRTVYGPATRPAGVRGRHPGRGPNIKLRVRAHDPRRERAKRDRLHAPHRLRPGREAKGPLSPHLYWQRHGSFERLPVFLDDGRVGMDATQEFSDLLELFCG